MIKSLFMMTYVIYCTIILKINYHNIKTKNWLNKKNRHFLKTFLQNFLYGKKNMYFPPHDVWNKQNFDIEK